MMQNAVYFMLKALFILRYFNFCSDFYGHVGKLFDEKAKVNSKMYDITYWQTNNYNNIHQFLKK